MECYLDNAATTKPLPEVCELVLEVMRRDYGNPSSLHKKGLDAERHVRQSAARIAKTLRCREKNIIFTSGGTEGNNMALLGGAAALARKGKHIVATCFEHASVLEPLIYLERAGYEVSYLPSDGQGHIAPDMLRASLRRDTVLVSVMLVNNEIGSVMDIQALADTVHDYDEEIIFHVDAVQAYGKMKLIPEKLGIDLMSVSGHKIHAPKGTGFLYRRDGVKMHALLHGGGQQSGMRSGTENVPGIAGLGLAAERADKSLAENRRHLFALKKYFVSRMEEVKGAVVNACLPPDIEETAPHIVSVSFDGVRSEVLLHALEEHGIYVSSGSACSSNHPGISGTLQAIGVPEKRLDSTLRFSFSAFTDEEQLAYTVEKIKELVPALARYTRK